MTSRSSLLAVRTRLWVSARGVMTAAQGWASPESQMRVANWCVHGGCVRGAEKNGPCASHGAESDLALGHDQNLGDGVGRKLDVSSKRDRLPHARNRGLESVEPPPNRRRTGRGRAGRAESAPRRKSRGTCDADHRQWHPIYLLAVPGNTPATRDDAPAHRVASTRKATATSRGSIAAKGTRSLGGRVSQSGGSAGLDRSLDRGVHAAVSKNEVLTA